MTHRIIIRAAFLAVFPSALLGAQSQSMSRGAVVAALGVGTGAASFTCDACRSGRDRGVSSVVRLGVGILPGLALGVEASGWTSDYIDPRGTGTARMLFAAAVAQWYPRGSGGFLKVGGGIGAIREEMTLIGLGDVTVTTSGPAFVAGIGWDAPIGGGRWAITPYTDLAVSSKADQDVNGWRPDSRLGGSLVHLGVAVTVR